MSFFPIVAPASPVSVALVLAGSVSSGANAASYSFAAANLGNSTSGDRSRTLLLFFVASAPGAAVTVDSLTISGTSAAVSASEVIEVTSATGNRTNNAVYKLAASSLPAGAETSGTISVALSGAAGNCVVHVVACYDADTTISLTNSNSVVGSGGNAGTISCPENGAILGALAGSQTGSDPSNVAWTNLTDRTSGGVSPGAGERLIYGLAFDEFAAAQAGLTVTGTPTNAEGSSLALIGLAPAP